MPPLLTVVVPAYRVLGYVRQCVESILAAREWDLEVVAIDDCSPDGTGAVLDEVAATDSRLQVIHLERNAGLGAARNLGLERATGDYVWFIDGDDWVDPAGVDAVCARLRSSHPDVLIVDYARAYWNHRLQRNVLNEMFRVPPAPDTFTLAERPSVLGFMMTAWNRVFRRQFLVDSGLRFGDGYYEDVKVTYPTLMLAERISLLDQVVYFYRQRRVGAITRTQNDKHFVVFDQYAPIFEFMDRHAPRFDEYRAMMFYRTFWHLIIILRNGDRIPKKREREYFAMMSEFYRRLKPPGYVRPEGREGTWERLVEADGYRRFRLINAADKSAKSLRRRASRYRTQLRRRWRSVRLRGLRVYYAVQRRMPLDDNLAVYGAYWYRNATCNPRAIYLKARELVPELRGAWVIKVEGENTAPEGALHCQPNTRNYYKWLARAKYLVNNVNFPDEVVKRPGQVYVQTQHGTPLKTMGLDQMKYPVGAGNTNFAKMMRRSDRWDFHLSQNTFSTEVWERSFPGNYEILESGYPRTDQLVGVSAQRVARLRKKLGLESDTVAILYAPTHRDYHRDFTPMLNVANFASDLGPGFTLMIRAHYYYRAPEVPQGADAARILNVSTLPYVEEIMLASDVLLTDYSSIMFDYAVLDRPIVVFANDYDTYLRTRGTNFDLLGCPPGAVALADEELVETFTSGDYAGPAAAKARAEFRRRFCGLDDGRAAERVVRHVFLGEVMDRDRIAFPSEATPVERSSVAS
jgi:CDP-glycerol glycerophosphotransferase